MSQITITAVFSDVYAAAAFLAGRTYGQAAATDLNAVHAASAIPSHELAATAVAEATTTGTATATVEKATPAPKSRKTKEKESAPKQEAPATDSPTATEAVEDASSSNDDPFGTETTADAPAAPQYTYQNVFDALLAMSKKEGGKAKLGELMKKYGIQKVTELQGKPELFGEIMASVGAA